MTDKEIIKALECAAGSEILCKDCAYLNIPYPDCKARVANDALALINRQQAEIERLEKHSKEVAENCTFVMRENDKATNKRFLEAIELVKSEAIKEFAERLKDYFRQQPLWNVSREQYKNLGFSYDDVFFGIDKVAKEMTEGNC